MHTPRPSAFEHCEVDVGQRAAHLEHVGANGEVSGVEAVGSAPALLPEPLPAQHDRMEPAQREQARLHGPRHIERGAGVSVRQELGQDPNDREWMKKPTAASRTASLAWLQAGSSSSSPLTLNSLGLVQPSTLDWEKLAQARTMFDLMSAGASFAT